MNKQLIGYQCCILAILFFSCSDTKKDENNNLKVRLSISKSIEIIDKPSENIAIDTKKENFRRLFKA